MSAAMSLPCRSLAAAALTVALLPAVAVAPAQAAAAAAACPSFAVQPAVPSAGDATDIVPADFDRDGDTDIAVANVGADTVTALLNTGSGAAFSRVDSPAGAVNPPVHSGIEASDLNQDGKADLIVTKLWQNVVTVLLGDGAGRFTPAGTFGTGSRPFDLAAGDFDADGHPDVAVANFLGNSVSLLFGDGTGGLGDTKNLPVGVAPTAVAVADLDLDGVPEVLVTGDGKITVVGRQFGRSFTTHGVTVPGAGSIAGVAVGDLNADLFPDVVVSGGTAATAWVLTNTGKKVAGLDFALTVGPAVPTGSTFAPRSGGLVLGDIDADNRTDVAVLVANANLLLPAGEPAVRLLTGDGSGGLSAAGSVVAGRYPAGLDLADLNGDGPAELIAGDGVDGVFVARNTCPLPAALDIAAAGVEAVQVVQDLGNSVPLIQGKRTVVRAYARANFMVRGVTAELGRVDAAGTPVGAPLMPANPGGRIALGPSPSRLRLNVAFLFDIPPEWAQGALRLRFRVNTTGVPSEANGANNVATSTVNFLPAKNFKVTLVDYRVGVCARSDEVSPVQCRQGAPVAKFTEPTKPEYLDIIEADLRRTLPVGAMRVRRMEFRDQQTVFPENVAVIPLNGELDRVIAIRQSLQTVEPGTIFVWVNSNWLGGVAYLPNPNFPQRGADAIVGDISAGPHEVGHLLGRVHTNCSGTEKEVDAGYPYPGGRIGGPSGDTERYVGFAMPDRATAALVSLIAPGTGDVMSYCSPTWPSDYTYRAWRQAIDARPALTDPIGDFLVVGGTVTADGARATLDTVSRVPQVAAVPAARPGRYRLRMLDGSGRVLADHPVTAGAVASHVPDAGLAFNEVVGWAPGTRRVVVVSNTGTELASRSVSANPPAVAAVVQSGGAVLPAAGQISVSWSGSDRDGDHLTASILYSADDGQSWIGLASGVTGPSYGVDTTMLTGTHGNAVGRFRVLLSDGVHSGTGTTGPFVVPGKPPTVRIGSPGTAARYELGQTVVLDAVAQDQEDGELDGPQVAWTSSIDGPLGTGRLRSARLSEGVHTIQVTATDGDGHSTSATATVSVARHLRLGSPPVADAGPDRIGVEGGALQLNGAGSADPDGDPLVYSWSVLDAPAAGARLTGAGPTPSFVPLGDGLHAVRLTVSDGLHPPSSDDVLITVGNAAPTVTIAAPAGGRARPPGPVTVVARYADAGAYDEHTCTVDWDAGPAEGTVDERARTCTATRTLTAGAHEVKVTVSDDAGASGSATVPVVVKPGTAGVIRGAGWFRSSGSRAHFMLAVKGSGRGPAPTVTTRLSLPRAGFFFTATSGQSLTISGKRAQFSGLGRVAGLGEVSYLITVEDRGRSCRRTHDRVRISIRDRRTGAIVYDNELGAPAGTLQRLGGGDILVRSS